MANILSSITSGYPIIGVFRRKVLDIEYLYPLALFMKTENLLYVFLHDKEILRQEPSGEVHIQAPDIRTVNFVLFEAMNNAVHGIYEYIINGFDSLLNRFYSLRNVRVKKCENCAGHYLSFLKDSDERCPTCKILTPYID